MLSLVHIRNSQTSPAETASLMADYLAFDRRRIVRRQYLKAFGAMAVIVMLGAALGRVVLREAEIVASLLLLPPLALSAIEAVQWYRLKRRLNQLRAEVQSVRKS
jgi:hypothetical protein